MSLARQFFREFRPLFRLLEEPFGNSPAHYGRRYRSVFDDPFFSESVQGGLKPAVDITEEGNKYIVEAELPGVKKENVEVRIGDNGQSLTIEGKVFRKGRESPVIEASAQEGTSTVAASTEGKDAAVTATHEPFNQISTERSFTGSSTFTRTVWLPRPVDSTGVAAKLNDGILTVTVPKAEDKASVKINVE